MLSQLRTIYCALCLFLTFGGYAQNGLFVSPGTSLYVLPGTVFSIDSLALTPSALFTINGANSETRTNSTIHPLSRTYISRVFHFITTLNAYNGKVTIYYRDAELNGIPEPNLTLNVYNGAKWKADTNNVKRNGTQNFVTTTLSNISLNELTLAKGVSTVGLSVTSNSFTQSVYEKQELNVKALPNPASRYFTLIINGSAAGPVMVRVTDAQGRTVEIKTNISPNSSLSIGDQYRPGAYFAEVMQGTQRVIVKLIKQSN